MDPSKEQCEQWLDAPGINPFTRRSIAQQGRIFNIFVKKSREYGLNVDKMLEELGIRKPEEPKGCPQWRKMTYKDAEYYDVRFTKPCQNCNRDRVAHAVHNEQSLNYECRYCKDYIDIEYLCIHCCRMVRPYYSTYKPRH